MPKQVYNIADFILSEMKRRDLRVSEFARLVGVSHATISKHLSTKPPVAKPEFLLKLSAATGASIEALIALAYPEVANKTALSARAKILAQRIEKLPESIQDFLLGQTFGEE